MRGQERCPSPRLPPPRVCPALKSAATAQPGAERSRGEAVHDREEPGGAKCPGCSGRPPPPPPLVSCPAFDFRPSPLPTTTTTTTARPLCPGLITPRRSSLQGSGEGACVWGRSRVLSLWGGGLGLWRPLGPRSPPAAPPTACTRAGGLSAPLAPRSEPSAAQGGRPGTWRSLLGTGGGSRPAGGFLLTWGWRESRARPGLAGRRGGETCRLVSQQMGTQSLCFFACWAFPPPLSEPTAGPCFKIVPDKTKQKGGGWVGAPRGGAGQPPGPSAGPSAGTRRRGQPFPREASRRPAGPPARPLPARPPARPPGLPAQDLADAAVADPQLPGDVAGSHPLVSQLHYPLPHHVR